MRVSEGEPGFVGAIQTFGDLIGWHSHVHAIVSEGLFKRDGAYIRIVNVDMERSMRQWPHSEFSIDKSVQIGSEDREGMQRLIAYVSRCPFSLARMIKVTEEGQVIYLAGKSGCLRFPNPGDERLSEDLARNFQVFDALERLERDRPGRGSGRDARVPDCSGASAKRRNRSY